MFHVPASRKPLLLVAFVPQDLSRTNYQLKSHIKTHFREVRWGWQPAPSPPLLLRLIKQQNPLFGTFRILQFQFAYTCVADYFGELCDVFCSSEAKEYRCSPTGEKICNPGETHGLCTASPHCHCKRLETFLVRRLSNCRMQSNGMHQKNASLKVATIPHRDGKGCKKSCFQMTGLRVVKCARSVSGG